MKKTISKLTTLITSIICVVVMMFPNDGNAQVLLNENFDYTIGDSLTAHGWNAHSGAGSNRITITPSSISKLGYMSSGVGNEVRVAKTGEDVNRTFTSQTADSVYFSFLVNVDSASTTGDYFLHLGTTVIGSNFRGRVFVKKDASNNLAFGVSYSASNTGIVAYTPFSYALNTTYLIVLKYKFVSGTINDVVSIIVDPVLNTTEPTIGWLNNTDISIGDLTELGSIGIRQGSTATSPYLKLDGIRVAKTWADIVGNSASTKPSVTSNAVSNLILNGATFNGDITAQGGSAITDRGFCYKTTPGVIITDNFTSETGTTLGLFSKDFISLSPNTQFFYKAYAANSTDTALSTNEIDFYTLANVPDALTIYSPTTSTFNITINPNNPAGTQFAIRETTTDKFVQANGTLGNDTIWQTETLWNSTVVNGLIANTNYTFEVKARNNNNIQTLYSTTASNTTLNGPAIIVLSSALDFGNIEIGSQSVNQTIIVSGTNLTDDITLTTVAPFRIKKSTDLTYSYQVILTNNGGAVANTNIDVIYEPTIIGVVSDTVKAISTGATNINIFVSGTGIYAEPSEHPTNFVAAQGTPNFNTIDLTWTDAVGTTLPQNYLIKWSTVDYASISNPVDGTPEANGTNALNVAQGVQTANIISLTSNSTYYFKIFPYTNTGSLINYKTDGTVPSSSISTATLPCGGAETFANATLTSSYAAGSFTGDYGFTWSYIGSRNESTYGITGKGIMFEGATTAKLTSASVPGGISSFTCSLKKAFTGSGNRQVALYVNGNFIDTCAAFDNTNVQIFTVNNINIAGDVIVEIRNNQAKQVVIDDISWNCYTPVTPNITIDNSNPAVPVSDILQSSVKNPIYKFNLTSADASANLSSISFTTSGTYTATDITKFQLWTNSTDNILTATQLGTDISTALGTGSHTFSGLSQVLNNGATQYLWVTTDVNTSATVGNTIIVNAMTTSDFTVVSGNKLGTTNTGGTQTIIALTIPTLYATTLADFGSLCLNNLGISSFTITGSVLSNADISIAALDGFSYSTTLNGTYTSTLTITQSGGSFSQVVYVKFNPILAQSYNGNIVVSGGGASSIDVAATGTGIAIPSAPTVTTPINYLQGATATPLTATGTNLLWYTTSIGGTGSTTAPTPITTTVGSTDYFVSQTVNTCESQREIITVIVYVTPEPTDYPTFFSASLGTPNFNTMVLTWTDAVGTTLPQNYLIKWSTVDYASIPNPVDGTPEANGANALNVAQGVQTATINGLVANNTYYFKIFPYTNLGAIIDFKTDGTVPQTNNITATMPCGAIETFTNSAATTSYATGTFAGDYGFTWSYIDSRNEDVYGITGKGLMFKGATTAKLTSATVPGGISSFTCSLKKAFTGSGNRQVALYVNGNFIDTCAAFDNTNVQIFTVNNINIAGDVIVEIRNNQAKQVVIDDISWNCYTPVTPNITIDNSNPAVPVSDILQSSVKNPIYKFNLTSADASANLSSVSFTTSGTYTATDITKFQLWTNSTDNILTATQLGTDISTALGTGSHTFSGLSQVLNNGATQYLWVTTDVNTSATVGNTIIVNAMTTSDFTVVSGNKLGTTNAGGTQTIIALTIPTLYATTLADFGSLCLNNLGISSFTITGSVLSNADISIAALDGFSYSTTLNGTYTSTLSIPQSGGSFSQDVYVKFNPILAQSYNGNIVVSGGGATSINVAVIGTGLAVPAAPTVTSPINYVQGATATPLTATGTNLLWYSSATGGTGSATAPTPVTTTVGSTDYFVSQTVNTCESPRDTITVIITAPICNAPTNLFVQFSMSGGLVEFNWTAGGTETIWNIRYKKSTETNYNNITDISIKPYVLSGLQPLTAYLWNVQAKCSSTLTSDWSAESNFSTPVGIDENSIFGLKVYSNNNQINVINSNNIIIKEVIIYDILGKELNRYSVNSVDNVLITTNYSVANYIVKVITDKNVGTYKLLIK